MNADNQLIYIVDDDMGEGFKDPLEEHNLEAMRQLKEMESYQDSYLESLRKFKSHGKHRR